MLYVTSIPPTRCHPISIFGLLRCGFNSVPRLAVALPCPHPPPLFWSTMSSIPNSLLQIQLETTLQMVMLSSSTMTANQLVDYRVRLTEASVVLGYVLAQRNEHDSNGTFTCILSSLLLSFEKTTAITTLQVVVSTQCPPQIPVQLTVTPVVAPAVSPSHAVRQQITRGPTTLLLESRLAVPSLRAPQGTHQVLVVAETHQCLSSR